MRGRVLIIAGSDSGGGAGIQADIKTVTALGGFAMTAITALTAQNTLGVHGVHEIPLDFIEQQIHVCLNDLGADAIKTGMLHSKEVIEHVVKVLDEYPEIPLICDPVMRAKGGASLLLDTAQAALVDLLLPRTWVLTPNIPEAEVLTRQTITTVEAMKVSGEALCRMGCQHVIMKGGHLDSNHMIDMLIGGQTCQTLIPDRIRSHSRHMHGTGCTLATAVATGVAQKLDLVAASERAIHFVDGAIAHAPGYGAGYGPLNHAWHINTWI